MNAQREFLWRLAIEVQKLEDAALAEAPGSRQEVLALQLRDLFGHLEKLPASHALFRKCRCDSVASLLDTARTHRTLVSVADLSKGA